MQGCRLPASLARWDARSHIERRGVCVWAIWISGKWQLFPEETGSNLCGGLRETEESNVRQLLCSPILICVQPPVETMRSKPHVKSKINCAPRSWEQGTHTHKSVR